MVAPDHSWGFLTVLVASIFAIVALLIGLGLGVAAARYGRSLIGWLLAVYVALVLAHVVVGFHALEAIFVLSIAFITGPVGYHAGRRHRRPGSRRARR